MKRASNAVKKADIQAPQARLNIEYRDVATLQFDKRNARTHSEEQLSQIAASIRTFGFTNPILIDEHGVLIAGEGRLKAAGRLGIDPVPTITLAGLSQQQRRAYALADNRIALNSGWNAELLAFELDALRDFGIDGRSLGFSVSELNDLIGTPNSPPGQYSGKIESPVYKPTGARPEVALLADRGKAEDLIAAINASSVEGETKAFLLQAAERHVRFDYHQIAEFYCHADAPTQRLMERSALVIIDFDQAVEEGYVTLSERIAKLSGAARPGPGEEPEADADEEVLGDSPV